MLLSLSHFSRELQRSDLEGHNVTVKELVENVKSLVIIDDENEKLITHHLATVSAALALFLTAAQY